MSKNARKDVPADMWLHVAADALARYVAAGGALEVDEVFNANGAPAVVVILPLAVADPRLPDTFVNLFPVPDGPRFTQGDVA
jgi:hypothetical protein